MFCLSSITKRSVRNARLISYMFEKYGAVEEVLKPKDVKPAEPKENQVACKMLAAPMDQTDLASIAGIAHVPASLPAVGGSQGTAVITGVGAGVKNMKEGDHVVFTKPNCGTWCHETVVDSENVRVIPSTIPIAQAATILTHAAAYHILNDFVKLSKQDVLLQAGAQNPIGQSIIQQCAKLEIETINLVASTPYYEDIFKHLFTNGANIIAHEDYLRTYKYSELVKGKKLPRLVVDGQGGKISLELVRKLDDDGQFVNYGCNSKESLILPPGAMANKHIKINGFSIKHWLLHATPEQIDETLDKIVPMVQDETIISYCKRFSMEELPHAVKYANFPYNYRTVVLFMED